MQFPISWLREICNPPMSDAQIADVLTMGGLEVEEAAPAASVFTGVVVGHIVEVQPHPDADRLRVCKVDVGQGDALQIVCGAPNARVGIRVPCATVGAALPSDGDQPFKIKVGKLRGVESFGMLCSAKELGVAAPTDAAGLLELAPDAPIGQDIRAHLHLDDTLLTLKLTPNLGHCLSVYGLARELSALTDTPLTAPQAVPIDAALVDRLPVHVQATDLCGRFSGRLVKGVNAKAKTPAWMVDRLARCGQRSVSPLVDISNYVMFEMGQPSHVFDADKIQGDLHVRWGRAGEQLKLLNGNTITLDEKVGVIADELAVESLAGIMGGDATAVSDSTQNIYVEAAFWWPDSVAGRGRRYQFSTDAGHRYERGVDPHLTVKAVERVTQLVLAICGGQAAVLDDQMVNVPPARTVVLRASRAAKIIGMPITQAQCLQAFDRLHFVHQVQDEDRIEVQVPSHRFDITLEEDLIEEVVRLIGYNQLPQTPPIAPLVAKSLPESLQSRYQIRHQMANLGYSETINFSFVDEVWEKTLTTNTQPILLQNPIASQMNVMRSSLMGSLLAVLKHNLDRKADAVRVFEIGRVFMRDDRVVTTDSTVKGIDQPLRLAGLAFGDAAQSKWDAKAKSVDFFDVKGDVESLLAPAKDVQFVAAQHPALHPGRCAQVRVGGQAIGYVGELHPAHMQTWALAAGAHTAAPVLFELDLAAIQARNIPVAQQVSKLQPVFRDLALLLPKAVTFQQLELALQAVPCLPGVERAISLFDVYKAAGAETISYAVRVRLQPLFAAMTDAEIEACMSALLSAASQQLGATLRA